jgi:hypothetical protein
MAFIANDQESKPSRGRDEPNGPEPKPRRHEAVSPMSLKPKRNQLLTIASNPASRYTPNRARRFVFQLVRPVVLQ